MSKGSCGEIRNKLLFIRRMKFVEDEIVLKLCDDARQLGNQIGELLKKVKIRVVEEKKKPKK
jgi:hypothetical protein